jgi:hypothetical protein
MIAEFIPKNIRAQPGTPYIGHTYPTIPGLNGVYDAHMYARDIWADLTNPNCTFVTYPGFNCMFISTSLSDADRRHSTYMVPLRAVPDPMLRIVEDSKLRVCAILREMWRYGERTALRTFDPDQIRAEPVSMIMTHGERSVTVFRKHTGEAFLQHVWECLIHPDYQFLCGRGFSGAYPHPANNRPTIAVDRRATQDIIYPASWSYEFDYSLMPDPLLWAIQDPKAKVCEVLRRLARHLDV